MCAVRTNSSSSPQHLASIILLCSLVCMRYSLRRVNHHATWDFISINVLGRLGQLIDRESGKITTEKPITHVRQVNIAQQQIVVCSHCLTHPPAAQEFFDFPVGLTPPTSDSKAFVLRILPSRCKRPSESPDNAHHVIWKDLNWPFMESPQELNFDETLATGVNPD